MTTHRHSISVRAPEGMPDAGCFRVVEAPMPSPTDGEVLVLTHNLSIDAFMHRQMGGGRHRHARSLSFGEVMIGRGAGIVSESRHPDFRVGDPVQGEHVALDARRLRKLPADLQPLSLSLGHLGQSRVTALVGLVDMAGIKAGDAVVVSAAPRRAEMSSPISSSTLASNTRRSRSGPRSPTSVREVVRLAPAAA